jgi:hypothetical protein
VGFNLQIGGTCLSQQPVRGNNDKKIFVPLLRSKGSNGSDFAEEPQIGVEPDATVLHNKQGSARHPWRQLRLKFKQNYCARRGSKA